MDFTNVEASCAEQILLPGPTGHHQIGVVTYYWVDGRREEVASDEPHDNRQIIADVYYPAVRTLGGRPAPYQPELEVLRSAMLADRRDFPRQLGTDMEIYACVLTSSFTGLPMSGKSERYPVLLFSPGGNMSRHWHTAMAQELASHGYVVAVMSHAHSGMDVFPRGGFVMSSPYWNAADDAPQGEAARLDELLTATLGADAIFTLDRLAALDASDPSGRFTSRLDLEQVAILGHSRGGSTVARACANDVRFRACIVYDNIGPDREVASGLTQPQLSVRRPWSEGRATTLHGYLHRNRTAAYDVIVDGTIHNSFNDLPLVEPGKNEAAISPGRAHRIIADVTLAFLRNYVRGEPGALLANVVEKDDELSVRGFGAARVTTAEQESDRVAATAVSVRGAPKAR